jgi:hypothetical protein
METETWNKKQHSLFIIPLTKPKTKGKYSLSNVLKVCEEYNESREGLGFVDFTIVNLRIPDSHAWNVKRFKPDGVGTPLIRVLKFREEWERFSEVRSVFRKNRIMWEDCMCGENFGGGMDYRDCIGDEVKYVVEEVKHLEDRYEKRKSQMISNNIFDDDTEKECLAFQERVRRLQNK